MISALVEAHKIMVEVVTLILELVGCVVVLKWAVKDVIKTVRRIREDQR